MKRVGFKMKLKPGNEKEYKRRHEHIWTELKETLTQAGIRNYSIFLDRDTLTLFAVQELEEENHVENLSHKEIMKEWWNYMKDLMETNPDHSPVTKPLFEVFHMD
jgi:L-rhamnose mutarotase